MKIVHYLLLALFGLSLGIQSSHAQSAISIHGGPVLSWVGINGISDRILPNRTAKVTALAGVAYETTIAEGLMFGAGLDYVRRGVLSDISTETELFGVEFELGARAHTTMDYISLPIYLKYITQSGPVRFYVYGGPRAALAIGGRIRTQAEFIIRFNTGTINLNPGGSFLESFELGGEIGTGVIFDVGDDEMFAGLQYYHSFTNVLQDPLLDVQLQTRGLGLQVGYRYTF